VAKARAVVPHAIVLLDQPVLYSAAVLAICGTRGSQWAMTIEA